MSRPESLASLLSHPETRTASTSLLVIGFLVGGSAAAAAVWWRTWCSLSWSRNAVDRSCQKEDGFREDQFICVLDGGSKQCRREAIEVATCFGVTDVWVRTSCDCCAGTRSLRGSAMFVRTCIQADNGWFLICKECINSLNTWCLPLGCCQCWCFRSQRRLSEGRG